MGKEQAAEKGKNVKIVLKFIRHGERDKEANLTDYGREITRVRAEQSGIRAEDFSAVKALGSDQGPKGSTGMGRSLETADIYARQVAGEKTYRSRKSRVLNFESLVSRSPYDHVEIYNSFLPPNYDELSDEEKAKAAKTAQAGVINHLMSLDSEEALIYKKEVAGSHAVEVLREMELAKRLYSGSRVLRPAGTHGGTMEFLLQQALVREDEQGRRTIGFKTIDEVGGNFDPSEAYTVDIETDKNGDFKDLKVAFDNPERPAGKEMFLDLEKVKELAEFYKKLHKQAEIDK